MRPFPAIVRSKMCLQCHTVYCYDYVDNHWFSYENKYLFHHSLLNDYIHILSKGPITFFNFCNKVACTYLENGNFKFVSNPTFRKVFIQFCQATQWSRELWCPQCDPEKTGQLEMVIFDGLCLSLRKRKITSLMPPTIPNRVTVVTAPAKSTRYIEHVPTRKLVQRWVAQFIGVLGNTDKV